MYQIMLFPKLSIISPLEFNFAPENGIINCHRTPTIQRKTPKTNEKLNFVFCLMKLIQHKTNIAATNAILEINVK